MSDPNAQRLTEPLDPATPCACGHRLDDHLDDGPCLDDLCECSGFEDNYEEPESYDAWLGGFAENH